MRKMGRRSPKTVSKENITIAGIALELTRKRNIKNIYLRVLPPDGRVMVSAPTYISDSFIRDFVAERAEKIRSLQVEMQERQQKQHLEYVTGEVHYLWGRGYPLVVRHEGRKCSVEKTEENIILTVPEGASSEQKEKVMLEWYREKMQVILSHIVPYWAGQMGLDVNEYRTKNMRTRWGSCNIAKCRIWLNVQLAKKPAECLNYVVVHELVHLWERNHTRRFYELVEQFYPRWRIAKDMLNEK